MQLPHHAHDRAAPAHVEKGAGLVEHQDARLHGKGPRDGDALLLAAREPGGVSPGVVLECHAPQLAPDALPYPIRGDPQVLGAKGDVIGDHGGHDLVVGVLEDQPQRAPRATIGGEVRHPVEEDMLPQQGDGAGVRGEQPTEDGRQRGLARPVGAQHADALALRDGERDVVQGDHAPPVLERDVVEVKQHVQGGRRHDGRRR